MKRAQSGKLPSEFLSLLSLGKVQKGLVPKSKRNMAGRTVVSRVNTARRMMKANGEVIPSYLTKSETRRLLLIYYWEHKSRFNGEYFYSTTSWRLLRALILEVFGEKCMKCGSVDYIAVDHIKSRLYHQTLELDPTNMQVLCRSCNSSKGARVTIDFRPQDWKIMLDSNQSISHLIADPNPVAVRPANPRLPQYLSITEDCEVTLHGREEYNTVLETLTSQLNRISAQLSTLQADGLIWWVGLETDKGWAKKQWNTKAGYRRQKSLKKLLSCMIVEDKLERCRLRKIHLSARNIKRVTIPKDFR